MTGATAVVGRGHAAWPQGRAQLRTTAGLASALLTALIVALAVGSWSGREALAPTPAAHSTVATQAAQAAHATRPLAPQTVTIPRAARSVVAAALARDYRITSMSVSNPAQRLWAQFQDGGPLVSAGTSPFTLTLTGAGRGSAIAPLLSTSPSLAAGLVRYVYPGITETWRNGPRGLEQSFLVADRPAGAGPLTLALSLPRGARLHGGAVLLPGGLRYDGLRVTDARGSVLRSWLAIAGGSLLIKVADRGAAYPLRIDPLVQRGTLVPTGGTNGDYVGSYMAVSGKTIVIGAPYATVDKVVNAGAAYVYSEISGHWKQTATLTPPAAQGDESFGSAVAISGNTIVASAPIYSGVPAATATTQEGAVYVFTHTPGHWNLKARLTTSDPFDGARLGEYSVAISGRTIVAGEPQQALAKGTITGAGAVYVYAEPAGGWRNATQTTVITEKVPEPDDYLGYAVAISGHIIAAGAPAPYPQYRHEPGVFLYQGAGAHWHEITEVHVDDQGSYAAVGEIMAFSGNTLVLGGQGLLYVVQDKGGNWRETASLANLYAAPCVAGECPDSTIGGSVAIVNGVIYSTTAAFATQTTNGAVAVPEFREVHGKWRLAAANIVGTGPNGNEVLGGAVAGDGNVVAVGVDDGEVPGKVVVLQGQVTAFGPLLGTVGVSGYGLALPVTCEAAHGSCTVTITVHTSKSAAEIGSGRGTIGATDITPVKVKFNSLGEHELKKGFNAILVVHEYHGGKLIAKGTTSISINQGGGGGSETV